MSAALIANTMIADLSAARFSSTATASMPAVDPHTAEDRWEFPAGRPAIASHGEEGFRPMRWLIPWLWQLSQRPVEQGQAIEWDVELPEGDRLRIHAVQHYGEWILDFAGSSGRLQRWLGQHLDELTDRLGRVIGKPVRVYLDPNENLSAS